MFPFDKKERIRRPSMFGDFDSFFAEFDDYASQVMNQAAKGEGGQFVYGYRAYTGEDAQYISEPLEEGALYEKLYLPGGGGFGDPLDRDVKHVERDLSLRFVSEEAAKKLYGAVGDANGDGEWKADVARSRKLRARMRKARLARARPVEDWWREQRGRIQAGEIAGETARMYAECLSLSPDWAKGYREFWALPKDFSFPAAQEG